jgi:hypothetical protein
MTPKLPCGFTNVGIVIIVGIPQFDIAMILSGFSSDSLGKFDGCCR